MQNYWASIFNVNGKSLPGPLIIGTFEKRAPDFVSEQTNSSQGDKAGKRCIGIGGGIRKTIEMWWLRTCVQF